MVRVEVKKFKFDDQGLSHTESIPLQKSNENPLEDLKLGISLNNNKFMHVFIEPIQPPSAAFRVYLSHPSTTMETYGAVSKNGIPHVYKDIAAIDNPVILHQEENIIFSAHVIENHMMENLPTAAN